MRTIKEAADDFLASKRGAAKLAGNIPKKV
jgi:hypothetical protein